MSYDLVGDQPQRNTGQRIFTETLSVEKARMLTSSQPGARPEIQRFVEEVVLENSRFQRELRSFNKEELVCPVTLGFAEGQIETQHCVSRKISASGISLISSIEFDEGLTASMELYRLKKTAPVKIIAECRWCKAFGDRYWISGWQFLRLQYNY